MHYGFRESGIPVVDALFKHRALAGHIIRDLTHAKSRALRSILILRHFLVSWFNGYQQNIAHFYLVQPILLNRRGQSHAKATLYLGKVHIILIVWAKSCFLLIFLSNYYNTLINTYT